MSTYTGSPLASSDDWSIIVPTTSFINNGADLIVGRNFGNINECGVRFSNINIVDSDIITNAKVTFQSYLTNSDVVTRVKIYGVSASDPAAPTSYAEVVALTKTTAFVDWEVPVMTAGLFYDTPDLTNIIEELQTIWTPNCHAILLFTNNASDFFSDRHLASYDSGETLSVLTVNYTSVDGEIDRNLSKGLQSKSLINLRSCNILGY